MTDRRLEDTWFLANLLPLSIRYDFVSGCLFVASSISSITQEVMNLMKMLEGV